jgi:CBS domain-containing protein
VLNRGGAAAPPGQFRDATFATGDVNRTVQARHAMPAAIPAVRARAQDGNGRLVPGVAVRMRVADIMTREVEFVAPDVPVSAAAELMGELDVGALPVGGPAELRGIVTDRDLLYRVVAPGLDASKVRVADVLSAPVVTCREEDALQAVLDLMAANHLRRLPVVDAGGRVTGWITLADLARTLLHESPALQSALTELTSARQAE